jgi:hypothetical protein
MNKEEKEINSLLAKSRDNEIDIKLGKTFKSFYSDKDLNSVNGLQFVSSFIQILLGTAVVALSLLELVQPAWVASLISILGCISIITGFISIYKLFSNSENFNSLINRAIKRVITFQN